MNAWFERFARKERLDSHSLWLAVELAEAGMVHANLGGHVIKQRVARQGAGKSGGYRTVILYRKGDRAVFVYGFSKSGQSNIDDDETRAFKQMAIHVLGLSEKQLQQLVELKKFKEVRRDDEETIQE